MGLAAVQVATHDARTGDGDFRELSFLGTHGDGSMD